jgi:peptide deformylase
VRGVDQHGGPVQLSGTGYLARCFIHESQHLDGTLYWDHLSEDLQADALEQRDEERPHIIAERREIAIELDKTPPEYPEKPAGGR